MLSLAYYELDEEIGCLSKFNDNVPLYLHEFTKVLENSYRLMATNELRMRINELPELDLDEIKTRSDLLLAHKLLSFLTSQFVWQYGDENLPDMIPAVLAKPLVEISIKLGCQPILGHIDLVLYNCFPNLPLPSPSLKPTYKIGYFPSDEKNWIPFIEYTATVELRFAPALTIMLNVLKGIGNMEESVIREGFDKIAEIVNSMTTVFAELCENLSPSSFYQDMRRYLSGWSVGRIKEGIVYEGVPDSTLTGQEIGGLRGLNSPKKRVYLGASAAQSVTIQAFDAFLGVKHDPDIETFLECMRASMVKEHRQFLLDLKRHSNIRSFLLECDKPQLKMAYNRCLKSIVNFREEHIILVMRYIVEPAQKLRVLVGELDSQGTSGQKLEGFLNRFIINTMKALIP